MCVCLGVCLGVCVCVCVLCVVCVRVCARVCIRYLSHARLHEALAQLRGRSQKSTVAGLNIADIQYKSELLRPLSLPKSPGTARRYYNR